MEDLNTSRELSEPMEAPALRKPTIAQVGILYLICIVLFVFVGSRLQRVNFNIGTIINEFGFIALPPVILLILFRYNVKKVLRLNKISARAILVIVLLIALALPLTGLLNGLNLLLVKYIFGRTILSQPPVASTPQGLIESLLVIAASAGICEETLFRGTIQRGLERLGTTKAILVTAFLFGLMHLDFQKLLGTFLLGALIGFIAYRTNSILGSMTAHFTNNAIAVLLSYAYTISGHAQNSTDMDFSALSSLSPAQSAAAIIFAGIFISFIAVLFIALLAAFMRITRNSPEKSNAREASPKAIQLTAFIPGLCIVGFLYFAEGVKLLGAHNSILDNLLRFAGLM